MRTFEVGNHPGRHSTQAGICVNLPGAGVNSFRPPIREHWIHGVSSPTYQNQTFNLTVKPKTLTREKNGDQWAANIMLDSRVPRYLGCPAGVDRISVSFAQPCDPPANNIVQLILYGTVRDCTGLYGTVLYGTVLCTGLYCTGLYCTGLYGTVFPRNDVTEKWRPTPPSVWSAG
eukprot:1189028-Prorocentrum_minimum.AAC.2